MSMKGKLNMYLAMAGLFGGMVDLPQPKRYKTKYEPDKNLTPEEIDKVIEDREKKVH